MKSEPAKGLAAGSQSSGVATERMQPAGSSAAEKSSSPVAPIAGISVPTANNKEKPASVAEKPEPMTQMLAPDKHGDRGSAPSKSKTAKSAGQWHAQLAHGTKASRHIHLNC